MLEENCQKIFQTIGSEGCYFLCLCHIIDVEGGFEMGLSTDILKVYNEWAEHAWIDSVCTIRDADKIIKHYFGEKAWVERHSDIFKLYEFCWHIARFENGNNSHFVIVDKDKNIIWNPLSSSQTVKKGKIESFRTVFIPQIEDAAQTEESPILIF